MQAHWEAIYAAKAAPQLGWYEARPEPSLALIARCGLAPEAPILDVGAGASTLVDCLLEQGYTRITALDLSLAALEQAQARLGTERAAQVRWVVGDILGAETLPEMEPVALWHDRALLHFLTDEARQSAYLAALRGVLRPGGYVVIAAFAVGGATMCSGLPLVNYTLQGLAERLGEEFELLESLEYVYTMPSGDTRPYVYGLFRRGAGRG